jgi:hypothetical protein
MFGRTAASLGDLARYGSCEADIVMCLDIGTACTGQILMLPSADSLTLLELPPLPDMAAKPAQHKVPTAVLLDAKTFQLVAFGEMALTMYADRLSARDQSTIGLVPELPPYILVDNFKMQLRNEQLTRTTTVNGRCGRPVSLMGVFVEIMTHARNTFSKTLAACCAEAKIPSSAVAEKTVQWAITMPGIWNERAKGFMNEAAQQAGFPSYRLVLESEAAAAHCLYLQMRTTLTGGTLDQKSSFMDTLRSGLDVGKRCLVVDFGGGTEDDTICTVGEKHTLTECHSSGGPWGSKLINEAMLHLLETTFGVRFVESWERQFPRDAHTLRERIEALKKEIQRSVIGAYELALPDSFVRAAGLLPYSKKGLKPVALDINADVHGARRMHAPAEGPAGMALNPPTPGPVPSSAIKDVEMGVANMTLNADTKSACKMRILPQEPKEPTLSYVMASGTGTLRLSASHALKMVQAVTEQIRPHLERLVASNLALEYMFAVGGFSACDEVRAMLKELVDKANADKERVTYGKRLRLILPPKPGLSVVCGGALLILNPNLIVSRVILRHYGIDSNMPWNAPRHEIVPGCHKEFRFYTNPETGRAESLAVCYGHFRPVCAAGTIVGSDKSYTHRLYPTSNRQKQMGITLYCTEPNVTVPPKRLETEDGKPTVTTLGHVIVDMPDVSRNMNRAVDVTIMFAGAHIQATAKDVTTGIKQTVRLNCLD